MSKYSWSLVGMLLVALGATAACSKSSPPAGPDAAGAASTGPSEEGKKFLLAEEPAGALQVHEARESAQDQQEVVVVGRIGGDVDPWVAEAAAFSIVDNKLVPCSERPGDTCPTPWDYCCDHNDLPTHKVLVKLVDDAGQVLPVDARKLLGVKALQTVVVRGRGQKDAAGNLVVLAKGIHVKR